MAIRDFSQLGIGGFLRVTGQPLGSRLWGMKKVVLLVLVLGLGAAEASAAVRPGVTEIVAADGSPQHPYQRWVNRAQVPTPAGTLTVIESLDCAAGALACTRRGTSEIWLYPGVLLPRSAFLHEVGHQFDFTRMTGPARAEFQGALGLAGPWDDDAAGTYSPHELFAEAYSLCADWKRWRRAWAREQMYLPASGFVGTQRQRLLCEIIWTNQ